MEVSGQLHTLATLPLRKDLVTHWIGGWVGLRAGLNVVTKRKILLCQESNPGLPACSQSQNVKCLCNCTELMRLKLLPALCLLSFSTVTYIFSLQNCVCTVFLEHKFLYCVFNPGMDNL
jgi:hypothetical protein